MEEPAALEARIRAICLALPEASERPSHGAPAFFAGKQFCIVWARGHHDDHRAHLWCAAPAGVKDALLASAPDRFFNPPYVGGRGWVGVRLDETPDWQELAELLCDAYRAVAPRRLLARLDANPPR